MDPKVAAFIEAGKKAEKEQQELEQQAKKFGREEALISLGLCTKGKKVYSDDYISNDDVWDDEKGKWLHQEIIVPDVTDEEFAEIMKYAKLQEMSLDTTAVETPDQVAKESRNAESYLKGLAIVSEIIAIIIIVAGIIFSINSKEFLVFVAALAIAGVYFINWAFLKVICNISNNLHDINEKIK